MQSGIITEYDDKLTRQLVERITLFEGKLQVVFKLGVDIEVEIQVQSDKGNHRLRFWMHLGRQLIFFVKILIAY